MNDDKLIEAMARAIAEIYDDYGWVHYKSEATAALEAYRIATQDDGK